MTSEHATVLVKLLQSANKLSASCYSASRLLHGIEPGERWGDFSCVSDGDGEREGGSVRIQRSIEPYAFSDRWLLEHVRSFNECDLFLSRIWGDFSDAQV
ncbi:unnamed protein product [Cuscuta epithymum]|uniref:Uncharacterized protein n=1 Tax=Cuscuta epithymum TaxID=186058 RepID=A0AAV0D7A0_9ASTE|nr:unnamed protein product [Cuscuta epithymum]